MKKFRFQSVAGIVFIYLFFVNVILLILALLTADIWFTVAAICLSLFQLLLHRNFRSIRLLYRHYQVSERLKVFNSLKFKVLVRSKNNEVNNYQQHKLINERATNKRSLLAIGSFSNPGYMEYERVRYRGKTVNVDDNSLIVSIGTNQCAKPYASSILNIGALSRETISNPLLFALSEGAKIGGFSINTGEGGISPYHIRGGGDLVWRIGPSYAGCSYADGFFNEQLFKKNATRLYVKMIELNLDVDDKVFDQNLPDRINPNVGPARSFQDGRKSSHAAFNNEFELLHFASLLRSLSGGKPVGLKTSIETKTELDRLCSAMSETGIYLDFITVEGGREGDYKQMPLLDAIAFTRSMLNKYNVPSKIIASGEIITEYDILRAIALGSDVCNSTRGMLLALKENSAGQSGNKVTKLLNLYREKMNKEVGLAENRVRVASYHKNTIEAVLKLMKLCAYERLSDVQPRDFYRRTSTLRTITLEDIYFGGGIQFNNEKKLLTSLN